MTEFISAKEANGYLTLREAADELGVTKQALNRAAYRGTLETYKVRTPTVGVGYYRVVDRAEIDRYRRENLGNQGRPGAEADDPPRSS